MGLFCHLIGPHLSVFALSINTYQLLAMAHSAPAAYMPRSSAVFSRAFAANVRALAGIEDFAVRTWGSGPGLAVLFAAGTPQAEGRRGKEADEDGRQ